MTLGGGLSPAMEPFWLMPGSRPPGNAKEGDCVSIDEDVETDAAEDRKSAVDLVGAMPHLLRTQPPTRRPRLLDEGG